VPLSRSAWQSRKARDLLKVLAAHRGRPVPREQVAALLWPDEGDDAAAVRRLNVQVSTLRAILDPERRYPPDHMVASADGALQLRVANVEVDAEQVLEAVAAADRLERAGRHREAVQRYRTAEAAGSGEVLPEDAYADWAVSLREEVRLAHAHAARRLAEAEQEAGRHDVAARYWLRLLEQDPYDEPAHLALVASLVVAGRHGDARRRYLLYAERMRELGVEPASFPRAEANPNTT
jgi:DNA-binding SARP family transcriptional activator